MIDSSIHGVGCQGNEIARYPMNIIGNGIKEEGLKGSYQNAFWLYYIFRLPPFSICPYICSPWFSLNIGFNIGTLSVKSPEQLPGTFYREIGFQIGDRWNHAPSHTVRSVIRLSLCLVAGSLQSFSSFLSVSID